jgi:acetyl-CoA carboxylase biotin carboxyl carrier protein
MNVKELKEMINLMIENELTELELEKDGLKVKLRRDKFGVIKKEIEAPTIMMAAPQAPAASSAPAQAKEASNIHVVRSPMVGTFYAAPAPDAEPYVTGGKQVEVDMTLCIIEAMKLMNEIKSDIRGKVVEVLATNGQAVEFDQPLFKIEKS